MSQNYGVTFMTRVIRPKINIMKTYSPTCLVSSMANMYVQSFDWASSSMGENLLPTSMSVSS